MARILLVEDEPALAEAVARGLRDEGHAVDWMADGPGAYAAGATGEHELIVLDLMLPGLSGIEVCRRLRQAGHAMPILMLTARDTTADVCQGLDAGANDYLTKPFAFAELLARVRALLRAAGTALRAVWQVGEVALDTRTQAVSVAGEPLTLTRMEYRLLERLMRFAGLVVTKDQLGAALWEHDEQPDSNVLEVYVAKLRKKLDRGRAPSLIRTVRGVGYRLGERQSGRPEPGAPEPGR